MHRAIKDVLFGTLRTPRAAIEKAARSQREYLDKHFGAAKFYGLCEVRSVKPMKEKPGSFLVSAREARDQLGDTKARSVDGVGWTVRYVEWVVPEAAALRLATDDRFNISGQIVGVESTGTAAIDDPLKVTISIEASAAK